ncbi:alpha/beta hydrolase [Chryseobacterium carnipullorum]|uniref:Alpha/beta hydrolase n=1 Tax=Chryseobacterium carnipullorum TaxID=1124835 RepID=A0A376DZW0_CHRCU|nr:alpha/beta hydrolase [Chryseobacterium carnipullorum]AZA50385.1 alpha/beta hydrolase [Chryseobacterium carnipullorum]AZA65258.1 alpha/beta hydrolase [Chryseobacterium carnipullorum]STC99063.1 Predicted dienelactone hydrolase [Chryseobacterium carnipullorum]
MNCKILFTSFTIVLLCNCTSRKITSSEKTFDVKLDTLTLFDQSRNRKIPVAFYSPKTNQKVSGQQVVIFSHGYGANKGGDYLVYSYLTEMLASRGYFTVSIQHELPTDELIPMEGKPQIVRMPFWERGTENILFVLNELKKSRPDLDYNHLTLIGHSNGGDMTALFAAKYPDLVYKIITLDNRRMYLSRTSMPKIYTLRSNDYPADEGVLPSFEEQKKYHITVQSTSINHGHMDNKGNDDEHKILKNYILKYIDKQ